MSRYTESQAKAAKKYLSGLSEIKIRLKPDEKRLIESYAAERGQSVNQYVKEAAIMHGQPQPKAQEQQAIIERSDDIPKEKPPVKAPRDISHLPQPPDTIPSDDMNAQIIWRLDHGWTEEEVQIFLSQN